MPEVFAGLGALLMALGVGAGAWGSHALSHILTPRELEIYDIAVRYHLLHGLGLFAVAFAYYRWTHSWIAMGGIALILGVVLFSGSLYVLACTGWRGMAFVTPFGGLAFIAGWLLVGLGIWKATRAA